MSLMPTGTPCSGPIALAVAAALVERAGLRQRIVRIEVGKGAHFVFDRSNAIEASAGILLRGNFAAGDLFGGFDRRQRRQIAIAPASVRVELTRQPEGNVWEDVDESHGQEDHEHEWQRTGENLVQPHVRRRHAL